MYPPNQKKRGHQKTPGSKRRIAPTETGTKQSQESTQESAHSIAINTFAIVCDVTIDI